jgi:predicted nucleotidyltransferase
MENKELLKTSLKSLLETSANKEDFISASEIIRKKIKKGLAYKDISESVFETIRNEVITESIFDPINETRSEVVFSKEDVMKPEIKTMILKIFEDWKKNLDVNFEIKEMRMIGSMTGFQYSNVSDIDINVITSLNDGESIWKVRKMLPNGNKVPNTNHEINFWVGEENEAAGLELKRFENVYDIKEDKWIKKSDKKDIKVPYPYVMELAKFFMNSYDLTLSETDRDMSEIKIYMDYDPNKQDIKKEEQAGFISRKLDELKSDIDSLKMGKQILRSFMVEGYEGAPFRVSISYEHEDPRYSMNSMVYKMVDRFGYLEKISDKIDEAKKLIITTEEFLKGGK